MLQETKHTPTLIYGNERIDHYKGITIFKNEDGYHTDHGDAQLVYCDTVEEIREEIDDYWNADVDPENIYNDVGIAQSIAQDRVKARGEA